MSNRCERSPSYDANALKTFTRALDEAWELARARQSLLLAPLMEQVMEEAIRQVLAKSIFALAATGERDLEELKRYALRDLSVRAWRRTIGGAEAA